MRLTWPKVVLVSMLGGALMALAAFGIFMTLRGNAERVLPEPQECPPCPHESQLTQLETELIVLRGKLQRADRGWQECLEAQVHKAVTIPVR